MLMLTARGVATKIAHLDGIYKNEAVLIIGSSPTSSTSIRRYLQNCSEGLPVALLGNVSPKSIKPQFWFGAHHPKCYAEEILSDATVQKFAPTTFMESMTSFDKPYNELSNMFFYTTEKDVAVGEFLAPRMHTPDYNSTLLTAIYTLYHLGFRRMYLAGCNFGKVNGKLHWYDTNISEYQQRISETAYEEACTKLKALKPVFDDYNLKLVDCTEGSRIGSVYDTGDIVHYGQQENQNYRKARLLNDLPHYTSFSQLAAPPGFKGLQGRTTEVSLNNKPVENQPMWEL